MPGFNEHNYFTLEKPSRSYKEIGASILKAPLRAPRWIFSFIFARAITHIAVAPDAVKPQKAIHPIFLTDDLDEKPTIIVNLLPKEKYKFVKDYFLKFNDAIVRLPFFKNIKRRQLSENDKEHIDKVLEDIDLLISGNSTEEHCRGHQFSWDMIHLKGLECLNEEIRHYFFQKLQDKYGAELQKNHLINLDFFSLDTGESSVLDSVAVSKNPGPINYSTEKFIISCVPRDQNYINWIKDYQHCLQFINATIIAFNYRGVDYSKGMTWTQDNMVKDAVAQVKRLLELGAKPENIGLEGMCIGGAVATIAVAELHAQDIKVHLYNERSFRSIPRLITGYIIPNTINWKNPLNWLKACTVGFTYLIVVPLIYASNWSVDAHEAWDKIPAAYKDYALIYDPSGEAPAALKSDDVINDSWASMASFLRQQRKDLIAQGEKHALLSEEALEVLGDQPEKHYFKLMRSDLKGPFLHSTPRRFLLQVNSCGLEKNETMSEYMAHSFARRLGT